MANGFHSVPFDPPQMESLDDPVCFMPGCNRPNPKWKCGLLWVAFVTIDEPQNDQTTGGLLFMPKLARFCSHHCAATWHKAEDQHAFDNDRRYGMHPDLHAKYVSSQTPWAVTSSGFRQGDHEQSMSMLQPGDYAGSGIEYEFDYPGHPRFNRPDLSTPLAVIEAAAKPLVPSEGSHWPPLQPRREP